MTCDNLVIRTADSDDARGVVSLLTELGYSDNVRNVESRIQRFARSERDRIFVALVSERRVGLASVHLIPLMHRDGFVARVTSFVVAAAMRRQGVGAALLQECEEYARSTDAERMEITSG